MTTTREVMTPNPLAVAPSETAQRVAQLLAKEEIGSVIVGDAEGLLGMITDRDLAVGIVAQGRDPGISVRELLSGQTVATVGVDDSIELAMQAMKDNAVRRLPVIDGDQVVGIISQADLAAHLGDAPVGDTVAAISEAPDNTNQG